MKVKISSFNFILSRSWSHTHTHTHAYTHSVSTYWGISCTDCFMRWSLITLVNKHIWDDNKIDFKLGDEKGIEFRINILTDRKSKNIHFYKNS